MPYIYSQNSDPFKAAYGEQSQGVLALQKALNQKNAGVAGYTPLAEDSKYGDLTKAAFQKYGSTLNAPTNNNPSGTPTNTPLGTAFTYTPMNNDPSLDAYFAEQQRLANTPVDENAVRAGVIGQFQDRINALNQIYDQKLKEAKLTGQGQIGQGTAVLAARGLTGSGRGMGISDSILRNNAEREAGVEAERNAAIADIMNMANTAAASAVAEKNAARDKGASAYIEYLKNQDVKREQGVSDIVKYLVSSGIDPATISPEQLKKISDDLKISSEALTGRYKEAKTAYDADQAKAAREGQFELGEGQARYDANGNLIASRAKTYAPKAGSGSGSSPANYQGQFGATIDAVANMESTVKGRESTRAELQQLMADGDYASAYARIANSLENKLTGNEKSTFSNARTDYEVLNGLRDAVQAYADAGGDLGLLKGKEEQIRRKLGIDSGKASVLATQLWREFQSYRNAMTGAAFGAGESADYAAVNPTLGKNLDLNLSVIEGAQNQLRNRITSTINSRVPSARYILEYAEGADQGGGGEIITAPDGTEIEIID